MKHALQYSLIGALFGMSTSYIIVTLSLLSSPNESIDGHGLLLQLIVAISLGICCGLVSLIFYYFENWSFARKLIIHYVLILSLVILFGAIGKWYDNPMEKPIAFLLFIGVQFIVYMIIYVISYWMNVKDVKEINEQLKKR